MFGEKQMGNSIQRISITVVSFCIGFIACIVALREWVIAKEILPALATLIAAFFGAWFAFSLQSRSKKKEERNKKISYGNKALFTLCQRVNNLWLIQKNIINPFREHPGIHIAMRPALDFENDDTFLDIDGLKFLLDTDYQQLLLDLHIEDQRYKTAIRLLTSRSHLHLNLVQPRLETAGITEKQYYSIEHWKEAIGQRLYLSLQRATEDLISNVDNTVQSNIEIKDRLIEAFKSLFPGEKFFNFDLNGEPPNQANTADTKSRAAD
jgi:hypothetical protein